MEKNAVWYTNGKGNNVKVLVCKDYDTLSKKAAGILAGIVNVKPNAILGLATGSSPVGTYKELIKLNQEGLLDFSAVRTYNLDEYYPLDPSNDQSYHYFMNDNLFDHVNIDKNNVHVPDGNAPDMNKACESYEAMLNEVGGVDIQVLGIGGNGHIGFNEPTDTFVGPTHVVELTESTIKANSRFFEKIEDVPTKAISMGIASIMKAKKILLVANGTGKADAIAKTLEGPITPWVPASILQLHPDVTIIVDEAAASGLKEYKPAE
ncbi:MAG: glucosamine-6-phosphate deaminase [Firmicutes bacterium]|jgi:glucosamine-6-phosphate deaminase|nr:glucosamine-6-phosphate deaminase [Bacillota bacterium]MBR3403836.1 glucosamine-6-phosphate deaminase [Bacillota bacterium]